MERYTLQDVRWDSQEKPHRGDVKIAHRISAVDRRLREKIAHVVEFPFPDDVGRTHIWRITMPLEVPFALDVDVATLATRYELSGGDIRRAPERAAHGAAHKNWPVTMADLESAAARMVVERGSGAV